jgi:hypothetical protein
LLSIASPKLLPNFASQKIKVVSDDRLGNTCAYASIPNQSGIDFMVIDRQIARVDISNPKVKTVSGAKVGDSEQRIARIYGSRLNAMPI